MTRTQTDLLRCTEADMPAGVRFDVPGRNAGQMVEIAYGTFGRGAAGEGDPWQMITYHAEGGRREYFRLVDARGRLAGED